MVSINHVAEIAGVSNATVSRCINDPLKVSKLTRAKVQSAIADTGYTANTLARSFRRGKTNMIMVVIPSVGDPFLYTCHGGYSSRCEALRIHNHD